MNENPKPGDEGYDKIYTGYDNFYTNNKQQNYCCGICINGGGGCRWTDDGLPIKGWAAEKTTVRIDSTSKMDSYMIRWCPEFKEGDKISENIEARKKGLPEPYELDDEGFMKLAERIFEGAGKDFKMAITMEKEKRSEFYADGTKWEKYYAALCERRSFDAVFPETIQKRIMNELNFKADEISERTVDNIAERKRKKEEYERKQMEIQAIENAARLRDIRLQKLEESREKRKEQKRMDKKSDKEGLK